MIINLGFDYEGFNQDGGRQADDLRRTIMKTYPNSIWERDDTYGHRIIVPD